MRRRVAARLLVGLALSWSAAVIGAAWIPHTAATVHLVTTH